MGCSIQKIEKQSTATKRASTLTYSQTPDSKRSCDVFNPNLGKFVSVPILVPASKSSIAKKRSIQVISNS